MFPKWKPHISTQSKFGNGDFRLRYKALRNSSSGFINRADVREYIFSRNGYKCVECGSNNDLQVDHIVSVYEFAKKQLDYSKLNIEENLQTLCGICNAKKRP